MLRDTTGTVRRQILTPDVFVLYNIGDYFNDLHPRQEGTAGGKNVATTAPTRQPAAVATTPPSLAKVRKPSCVRVATMSRTTKPRPAASKRGAVDAQVGLVVSVQRCR